MKAYGDDKWGDKVIDWLHDLDWTMIGLSALIIGSTIALAACVTAMIIITSKLLGV